MRILALEENSHKQLGAQTGDHDLICHDNQRFTTK